MPWDSNINHDLSPVYPRDISAGPRLGFMEGFEASFDAQVRNGSLEGLAWYFSKADDEQADRARKAGKDYKPLYAQDNPAYIGPQGEILGEGPDIRYGWDAYKDIARSIVDGEENRMSPAMRAHDEHIAKLNAEDPSLQLKTMTEMLQDVRKQSQSAEQRDNLSHTFAGSIGGFLGGAVGGLDPRTSPLNVATLPIGGVGKTVVGRVATQALGQGAIEAVNQFTGVQENRRLLGLDYGTENALWNIGGAALGGGLLQGVGEAATFGIRRLRTGRWFEDAPNDPAPPRPPEAPQPGTPQPGAPQAARPAVVDTRFDDAWRRTYDQSELGLSRMGAPRGLGDIEHVASVLRDWGGARAWEIAPPTETRIPGVPQEFAPVNTIGKQGLDSTARSIDPDLFHSYDKLAQQKEDMRRVLSDEDFKRSVEASKATADVSRQIRELEQKIEAGPTKRLSKKYQERIAELNKERDAQFAAATKNDTPEMAGLRQQLMDADYGMRDMAPSISRAYARAQERWDVYEGQRAEIAKMIDDGKPGIGDAHVLPEKMPTAEPIVTPRDAVPELQRTVMQPGETMASAVARVSKENEKMVSDGIAQFQESISKIAKIAPEELPAERERLDKAIAAQKEKLAAMPEDAKGKMLGNKGMERIKLSNLERERKELDNFVTEVNGKEVELSLDGDKITLATDDGGTRTVTARELLKELEHDNDMLKAVTSCSLNATS
jgi:hypothetical protein